MKNQSHLAEKLDLIFLPIAKESKSIEDFLIRSRTIKSVDPDIANYFAEKFGKKSGKLVSINQAAANYLEYSKNSTMKELRPSKRIDSKHLRFKQMMKKLGFTYRSLAADLGLEYTSVNSMLAPSKELPKWAESMLLVYEKLEKSTD